MLFSSGGRNGFYSHHKDLIPDLLPHPFSIIYLTITASAWHNISKKKFLHSLVFRAFLRLQLNDSGLQMLFNDLENMLCIQEARI